MGMYDSVDIICPNCGHHVDFQSKAGDCVLDRFTKYNAPIKILADINGNCKRCDVCDYRVSVKLHQTYCVEVT